MGVAATATGPLLPKMAVVAIAVSGAFLPRAVPSAAAWADVEPARRAATALNIDSELPTTGGARNGSQARMVRSGNAAASGRTPITECASPSSRTVRPSTPGSPLKRCRHKCSDRTTTGPRTAVSSGSLKGDPINMVTPSAWNRLAEAATTRMRSGSPASVNVVERCDHAARLSTVPGLSLQAWNAALLKAPNLGGLPPRVSLSSTSRSAFGHGSGFISTP